MPLWMVLAILGTVEATVGPLPYGLEECESRAAAFQEDARAELKASPGMEVSPGDLFVFCLAREDRPQLGDRLEPQQAAPVAASRATGQ